MTTVMPSTHLDTPSAELYAEVTGMLARVTKTMDDDQSIVPSSREETEQALRLALIAMTEEYGSLSEYLTAGLGLPTDFAEQLQIHALVADPDADGDDRRTLEP